VLLAERRRENEDWKKFNDLFYSLFFMGLAKKQTRMATSIALRCPQVKTARFHYRIDHPIK
jgi:hypothetical protein